MKKNNKGEKHYIVSGRLSMCDEKYGEVEVWASNENKAISLGKELLKETYDAGGVSLVCAKLSEVLDA